MSPILGCANLQKDHPKKKCFIFSKKIANLQKKPAKKE